MLCDMPCELGEGPSFDPHANTLWWFDITARKLFEKRMDASPAALVHELPVLASVIARIDAGRQLLATETGLHVRDVATGSLTMHMPIEADNGATRSNDGRVHPCGALWIGTMGKQAQPGAGAIYWYRKGEVRKLYDGISIPNSICFSPAGDVAWFTDTPTQKLMRVACDPATGLPGGEPKLFFDNHADKGFLDGSVVDADGNVWNARWGAGSLDRYSPAGKRIASVALPATQTSCPAFIPGGFAVTSAWQGMGPEKRKADPKAGLTFKVEVKVRPRWEPDVHIA